MPTRREPPRETASGDGSDDAGLPDARIAELESEAADARDRHLRLAADFENFKKRARQEQLDTIQFASIKLVERLLPALDDLHRALDHAPEGVDEGWRKGLELAVQKIEDELRAQGLTPIEAVGERFDPTLHEAVGSEESAEQPEDTVLQELRRGYRMHDRLVRPALVRVSRRPAELSSSETTPDD
jgi:molecular chaperone GrpE